MKIAFLGDIALIGQYDLTKNPLARERIKKLAEKLLQFDYVVANLESPLTTRKKTMVCKSMHLKSQPVNVKILKYLHINAVSLANNHLFDYGAKGLDETIAILEKNDIGWFGVNSKILIKEFGKEKICFSGFCCYSTNAYGYVEGASKKGINTLTYDNVMRQLEFDRENQYYSIMSFHWGDEHTNYPKYEHIRFVEVIAKKKDTVICGHHPHIIQGVQKIKDSIVAYSLGNCLFDDCTAINGSFTLKQNSNNKISFIFEVDIDNSSMQKYAFHGFKDEKEGIVLFNIIDELSRISEPLQKNIDNVKEYEAIRRRQFNKAILDKFGQRDFKWLLSRLNYYSIGARFLGYIWRRKYLKEVSKFLGGIQV